MRIEHADLSLIGDREDNQDRVTVAATDKAALLVVIDGMGGHSDGSRAADTALKSLIDSFQQTSLPMSAYWAHVGDSRIYHIRHGKLVTRTRDHSHVELLLREGKITEEELPNHPMRNFVECCLGGDPAIPEMTISGRHLLQAGDVLLLCTDGIWANLRDTDIAAFFRDDSQQLRAWLEALGRRAVQASSPFSDNSTAAVMRYLGA